MSRFSLFFIFFFFSTLPSKRTLCAQEYVPGALSSDDRCISVSFLGEFPPPTSPHPTPVLPAQQTSQVGTVDLFVFKASHCLSCTCLRCSIAFNSLFTSTGATVTVQHTALLQSSAGGLANDNLHCVAESWTSGGKRG